MTDAGYACEHEPFARGMTVQGRKGDRLEPPNHRRSTLFLNPQLSILC